jgi:hypothetical protein
MFFPSATLLYATMPFESIDGQRMFCAPYVFCKFPDKLDAFTNVVIIQSNVLLRKAPSTNASVVEILSYDIVKKEWEFKDLKWMKVTTPNNMQGYILNQEARSPIDYRAYFVKVNGRWKMRTFIAGD